jgi:hypothetical protein
MVSPIDRTAHGTLRREPDGNTRAGGKEGRASLASVNDVGKPDAPRAPPFGVLLTETRNGHSGTAYADLTAYDE